MQAVIARYLIVTGIGSLIVLAVPTLVILGFFLLVIPGLVMSLLPCAFLYGVVFAVIWWLARVVVGDWPAVLVAVRARSRRWPWSRAVRTP